MAIIEALVSAGERRQELVELVSCATDPSTLAADVAALLDCSPEGAEHALDMPLRRLTPAGQEHLRLELANLRARW